MSDNVIFPPRFAENCHFQDARQRAEKRQRAEAEQHGRAVARLRTIENGGSKKKGPIFKKNSDRVAAGMAVGALVRRAKCEFNVTVEAIKSQMSEMPRATGTTRLDRYMLDPDLDPRSASAKVDKLMQRVSGYLVAADAVARLTRQDRDALKIRVLRDTSLWADPTNTETDDDPRAIHLAMELNEMGRAVVRRSSLEKLFARARRVPGTWNAESETFASSQIACLFANACLDSCEHWTEAPPLPSVPLIRHVHAVIPTAVRVETVGRSTLLDGNHALRSDFAGEWQSGWFELSREIRIALGPVTAADDIGPMFESRAYVALGLTVHEPKTHILSPNYTLKPVDDLFHQIPASIFQVQIDGLWHRVATGDDFGGAKMVVFNPNDDPIMWSPNPYDPRSLSIEHWYFSWGAINSESVRYWFDRPFDSKMMSVVVPLDGSNVVRPTWYALPSVAHDIEQALAGVEIAITSAVQRFGAALEVRETEWRREASAAHEERMAMWNQDN